MKKRKVFVGLLLGAAAFGLAACTTGGNSTTSGENTPSTTQGVTPTTSNTTPSGDNTQSNPTAQKYTVKYYAVVGDDDAVEVTAAAQEVEEGKTTTAPEAKLAKDGYKVAGYFTDEGCGEEFKFTTTITKNTKVYVKYEALSTYDLLAASTNKVVAYDFSTATTLTEGNEFGATTPTLLTNDTTNVKVENGAVSVAKNNFLVDFGKTLGTGVINAYFEVTFKGVKNKEGWLQLNGDSYINGSAEVLGLRTDTSNKLAYRVDGGDDITNSNSPTISQNSTYKILMTIDTADQTLTVKIDDTVLYDKVAITATQLRGIKFTAKSGGEAPKVVDNIAVTFESKDATALVAAKNEAVGVINTYKASDSYTGLDKAVQGAIDTKIAEFKKSISEAADANAVATVKTEWNTFAAEDKYFVPVKAYTAVGTAAANATDYKIVIISADDDKAKKLEAVSFAGYTLGKIYSDAEMTTEATVTDIASGKTLYAKVTESNVTSYSVSYSDFDATTGATNLSGQEKNGFKVSAEADNKVIIASNSVKFGSDGSTSKNYISIQLTAGTYTVKVNAKSGSTGSAATFAVNAGTATSLTFQNDAASDQTTEITLTETTTVYFYRNGGKTINLYSININKK